MKNLLLIFSLFFCCLAFGQILTINSEASISIPTGSSINVGGLELSPQNSYLISGPNSISRSNIPIQIDEGTSIGRVFSSAELLSNYSGMITFHYLEGDLNGVSEEDLVLELKNEDLTWTTYDSTINPNNNTVSYNFSEVAFKAITASDIYSTLNVDNPVVDGSITVYPNPTAERLYIKSKNITKITLYNVQGQEVLTSTQNQLNMSNLNIGIYILKVYTEQNISSSFKIIKK